MAYIPIWKDVSCSITHGNYFRISGGTDEDGNYGGVFYIGRAVSPTGSGTATVYYNRLCAPRLHIVTPSDFLAVGRFSLVHNLSFIVSESADGNSWTQVVNDYFLPDWSYDLSFSSKIATVQITDHFHPLMTLLFSVENSTTSSYTGWYIKGGTTYTSTFNPMTGCRTAVYPLSSFSATGATSCGIGTLTFSKRVDCAPCALYFVDAYGGWASFLVEGAMRPINDTTRWTRKTFADNSTLTNRDERAYVSEITRRWSLSTGGLTDTESAKMWHLLESNNVWMHDFATGDVLPVVLEDGSQEVKHYKTNGRQMSVYSFTARLAQDRMRR